MSIPEEFIKIDRQNESIAQEPTKAETPGRYLFSLHRHMLFFFSSISFSRANGVVHSQSGSVIMHVYICSTTFTINYKRFRSF